MTKFPKLDNFTLPNNRVVRLLIPNDNELYLKRKLF